MRRFLPFVYLVFLSFLFVSCWKKLNMNISEGGLPHGENTLYYYVDGRLIIPETIHSFDYTIHDIGYYFCPQGTVNAGALIIMDSNNLDMLISESDLSLGRHEFHEPYFPLCDAPDGTSAYIYIEEFDSNGRKETYPYETRPGSGYIHLDYISPDRRRFIGTFEMTIYNTVTGRVRHITDGHFNLNLDKLHGY